MSLKNKLPLFLALIGLLAFAGSAAAQTGPVRNGLTSQSQLNLTANAQNALQLDIVDVGGQIIQEKNRTVSSGKKLFERQNLAPEA